MEAVDVQTPHWELTISKADVRRAVMPYVREITYTDHVHGLSDDISIILDDTDGRWRTSWYPVKGDMADLRIGYEGEPLLPCGQFSIDQVVASGPPEEITIRALAAEPTAALRTANSRAYESITLEEIARRVADHHGYKLVGPVAQVEFERVTQDQERDLAFLKRMADQYGHAFTVRGDKLIFIDRHELAKQEPVAVIDLTDMLGHEILDQLVETYKACTVTYFDPATKQKKTFTAEDGDVVSGDTLNIFERCEDDAQAMAKAEAALKEANTAEREGWVSLPGDPRLVAGNNVELTGLGQQSGLYQISQSQHRLVRTEGEGGGYTTAIQVGQGVLAWQG